MKFGDIEMAFEFVSADQRFMNNAILSRKTGELYYTSELGNSDELPDDVDDMDTYVSIPHKNDLDLGTRLVFDFVSDYMPDDYDEISYMFNRRGAYSRFKDLVERRGKLEDWYAFEEENKKKRLMEWCKKNDIHLT